MAQAQRIQYWIESVWFAERGLVDFELHILATTSEKFFKTQ